MTLIRETPRCHGCGRLMSWREADEQGACNDCGGGAYEPMTCSHQVHNGMDPRICADCGAALDPPASQELVDRFVSSVSVRTAYAFGDWPPAR